MSLPGNGIFVVQGEMSMLVTAMRRSTRWGSHSFPNEEYDVLMKTFQDLKTILNQVDDLKLLDPATYLSPFLEVIRSKETTGPVTSLALSAIHKFLSYGLIDPTHPSVPATVEDIADAVTHARFVGTDHSSDGVVLMKILQVLRTLMLSPEGAMLTDESVCEIMLSCFRICFETRLTELLRRNAEQCLRDVTQLIFTRLPQFPPTDSLAASLQLSLKKKEKQSKRKGANNAHSTNSLDRNSSLTDAGSILELQDNKYRGQKDTEKEIQTEIGHCQDKNLINEAEITIEPGEQTIKSPKKHGRHSSMDLAASGNNSITQLLEKCVNSTDGADDELKQEKEVTEKVEVGPEFLGASESHASPDASEGVTCPAPPAAPAAPSAPSAPVAPAAPSAPSAPAAPAAPASPTIDAIEEYVNPRGIRFTSQEDVGAALKPYGLLCVRELFRFLVTLCNPLDPQNTSAMVSLGLSLIQTALEVGVDQIANYPSLLYLVKDPLSRNLLSLLSTERITIFALDLQVSFLLFEALRFHLKYQMEAFFKKLIEIISTDTSKAIYELKEIHHLALESLAQMFRIPGLCSELYLNYDCDIYCVNIFEEITKLLSKNVVSSSAYNIHTLSLEAMMTIIEAIESGCSQKVEEQEIDQDAVENKELVPYGRGGHVSLELGGMEEAFVSDDVTHHISQYVSGTRLGRHKVVAEVPSEAELDNIRNMKKWVTKGTELFNQKPEQGIVFLQEHGVFTTPLDPKEVALFLRENPDLDKKMIGEYICKRTSVEDSEDGYPVLGAFAESFDFTGIRIDQALRLYLETFRLPGEAPLIFLVMERFAERWHSTNGSPFFNTDAAFRLAYSVIMLNMDQHNHNAKKLNVPMNVEDFVKNLRGCNGTGDFDHHMLEQIYHSIKNEEMIMPAERVGAVRDGYLWRVLQRRSLCARYWSAATTQLYHRLFATLCPSAVTALSSAFERAAAPTIEQIDSNNIRDCAALNALNGLERCAALVARLPTDAISVDTVLLTLCKFTGLLAPLHMNYIAIGVSLGGCCKAQWALQRAWAVLARHADLVRDAWRHLLDLLATLFQARLLPKELTEVEDYLAPEGKVSLLREVNRGSEAGLLSSLYSYIALGESGVRMPSGHEKQLMEAASSCVSRCNLPAVLLTDTKFLVLDSLQELIHALITVGAPPDPENVQMNPQLEDNTIFFLELLGQILIQNRDRLSPVWEESSKHFERVVLWASKSTHRDDGNDNSTLRRALTALLRCSARLMRCEQCASIVLDKLDSILFQLPYSQIYTHSVTISCGLYELVKTSAQNVHSAREWKIVFSLLLAAGAGVWPNGGKTTTVHTATSSRSEGSDDEIDRRPTSVSSESELSHSPQTQGWIVVQKSPSYDILSGDVSAVRLRACVGAALARCCEALALVVRDVAHVTPHNCRAAVAAVRLAARAAAKRPKSRDNRSRSSSRRGASSSDEEDDSSDQYNIISMQLLDLMHTLHSRTAQIFKWWRDEADGGQGEEEYDLWEVAWQPLLQGIAQFCADPRKEVSSCAVAYLQRALLVPALGGMGGARWEACFHHVLFPVLRTLPAADLRQRAHTILCKVFLQHLPCLSGRATFPALWLRVVAAQRSLVSADHGHDHRDHRDDHLTEAAVESLKNCILVMHSVNIFKSATDGYNDLWYITWDKIEEFLPGLKNELFPDVQDNTKPTANLPPHMVPTIPSSLPTLMPVPPSKVPPHPPQSPVNLTSSPPSIQPMLVAPTPISGMLPIRNQLYDQSGLTSSVLLQPLNEMISTPISVSLPTQIPIVYQQQTENQAPIENTEPYPQVIQATSPQTVLDINYDDTLILPEKSSEIYSEYLTNPYNEKLQSNKEATLYEPEVSTTDQISELTEKNLLLNILDKQKSLSTNTTPMHMVNKAQFGSSDNIKQSGVFNFSNYFGGNGSEVFDNLTSNQDG